MDENFDHPPLGAVVVVVAPSGYLERRGGEVEGVL